MNNLGFQGVKELVFEYLSNNVLEVNVKTNYRNAVGIYMIYIDNFQDEMILPVYIGQSDNIQRRHSDHLKELMSLNRLTKEYYLEYLNRLFYNGHYKSCKIFKYMVDNNCTLNDFHMIILEECCVSELENKEKEYIKKFNTEYFGFNQLETISNYLKPEYQSMSDDEKDGVRICELSNLLEFLEYGYSKFNFILAYGLGDYIDTKDDLKKLKQKIKDKITANSINGDFSSEYNNLYDHQQKNHLGAIHKYLIPKADYIDFPLKKIEFKLELPKAKKNECIIYFFISNNNRLYGETNYCAEIVKIITKQISDNGNIINEYYIENESFNQIYYEKDYHKPYVIMKKPFQVITAFEDIKLITLTTELKTGINDYELRGKKLLHLNIAVNEIINSIPEGTSFKLMSNQSKKVIDHCLMQLSYTNRLRVINERSEKSNLDTLSILIINNDCLKEQYYKIMFKEEGIKMRRVNDFTRGIKAVIKNSYDYIILKIEKPKSKSIPVIKELYEMDIKSNIIVINNGGVKGEQAIEGLSNIIVFNNVIEYGVLMKLFTDYSDEKAREKCNLGM